MASFRNHKVSSEIHTSYEQAGEVELREHPFEKTGNTGGISGKTDAHQAILADNVKNTTYNNELMRKKRKRLLFILLIAAVTTVLLAVVATVPFLLANAGPTTSSDQIYIQELKNQIAELKEALNITNHELKALKKDVEDVVKPANTNNETKMTQLQETVNITIQGLNELKKEVRESANFALTELQNSIANLTIQNTDVDLTALWLAVNSTNKMLGGLPSLWTAVNASSKVLNDVKMQVVKLDQKVKNNNKTIGSRGPPGYNGTQGSAGSPGSQGLPGPPGIGSNITLCTYKTDTSPGKAVSRYARNEISVAETKGKKILGVNCDTNDAMRCLLSSTAGSDGRRTYKCKCSNTKGSGDSTMYCYIHYWECQTDT